MSSVELRITIWVTYCTGHISANTRFIRCAGVTGICTFLLYQIKNSPVSKFFTGEAFLLPSLRFGDHEAD